MKKKVKIVVLTFSIFCLVYFMFYTIESDNVTKTLRKMTKGNNITNILRGTTKGDVAENTAKGVVIKYVEAIVNFDFQTAKKLSTIENARFLQNTYNDLSLLKEKNNIQYQEKKQKIEEWAKMGVEIKRISAVVSNITGKTQVFHVGLHQQHSNHMVFFRVDVAQRERDGKWKVSRDNLTFIIEDTYFIRNMVY